MTRRALVITALLLLSACNRSEKADAPDADADLRAKTAAKTSADLAAADAAARRPLPRAVQEQRPAKVRTPQEAEPAADMPDGNTAD